MFPVWQCHKLCICSSPHEAYHLTNMMYAVIDIKKNCMASNFPNNKFRQNRSPTHWTENSVKTVRILANS